MRFLRLAAVAGCLVLPTRPARAQTPDPFVGHFHHPRMDVELAPSPAGYEGWLVVEGERYEITAQKGPHGLQGTFRLQGHYYEFTGKLSKDGLTLWLPIAQSASEITWRLDEFKRIRYEFERVGARPDRDQRPD